MNTLRKLATVFATLVLLVIYLTARAATIAGASIELDGVHVAGYAITHKDESRQDLYDLMASRSLTFERDFKVPVDQKTPTTATLKGTIRIYTRIAKDRELATTTTELKLVQVEGANWRVDAESLARAMKAWPANQNGKPAKADARPKFTVWDSGWKVQSTYRLSEKGLEKLKKVLSRKPDETTGAAIALVASGTLQYDGQSYAIEPDKLILSTKRNAQIWNEKGLRDELIKLSDLQPHQGK